MTLICTTKLLKDMRILSRKRGDFCLPAQATHSENRSQNGHFQTKKIGLGTRKHFAHDCIAGVEGAILPGMNSLNREKSEFNSLRGETVFSPELTFVTDWAHKLLSLYGEGLTDALDMPNCLVWRHNSGDFALTLISAVLKDSDQPNAAIIGTESTFQYLIYDRQAEGVYVTSQALDLKYPLDIDGIVTCDLVSSQSLYIEEQQDWEILRASERTKPTNGDLAWFEVGLSLMETELKCQL